MPKIPLVPIALGSCPACLGLWLLPSLRGAFSVHSDHPGSPDTSGCRIGAVNIGHNFGRPLDHKLGRSVVPHNIESYQECRFTRRSVAAAGKRYESRLEVQGCPIGVHWPSASPEGEQDFWERRGGAALGVDKSVATLAQLLKHLICRIKEEVNTFENHLSTACTP